MPRKTFRSNNSTVNVKRRKFGAITRRKINNKRPKLVLIDEKNENNWKILKSELGFKTDSLFLEYLLNLAQKDLSLFRSKKRQASNESEETLKTFDCNPTLNNEKQAESYVLHKIKYNNLHNPVENEKKKNVPLKNNESEGNNKCQNTNEYNGEISLDQIESNNIQYKGNFDSTGEKSVHSFNTISNILESKCSKLTLPDSEPKKNFKTENAKNLDVDCKGIFTDKNRENKTGELLTVKECNFHTLFDSSQNKNFTSAVETSSHKSKDNLSLNKILKKAVVHCQNKLLCDTISHKREVIPALTGKLEELPEASRDAKKNDKVSLNQNSKSEVNYHQLEDESINYSKSSPRNILCIKCNKRHLIGKCPLENSDFQNQCDIFVNVDAKKSSETYSNNSLIIDGNSDHKFSLYEKKIEYSNVYDFDESEKEINIESNSIWSHKLLKAEEMIEDNLFVSNASADQEELLNSMNANDSVINEGGYDSDSSNSGLKLKIDESLENNLSFAETSLPENLFLKILDEEHGQSIFSKSLIPKCTYFGPLVGENIKERDIPDDFNMKFIWEINLIDDVTYISTKDPGTSNWLRYLRPAYSKEGANLTSIVKQNLLYFVSSRDIKEGEELIYWMDDRYSAWSKKKLEKKNCGGCNIQFSHPLYYRRHCMIFHDPTCSLTIRKYHCKICGLAVLGKEKIMKHAAEMHQGKGAYQCQYCHKFFLRLNYLEMHRTYGCSKNPQRSRPLCDLCGRKFCQPQKLKVHIKRMHSDMAQVLKDFQCKNCLKILGSRAALQRHMKEVHNKDIVGACTCDRCGKMFQNKSNLKIHMLTHSGVKPFRCQQADCTAAFTTKQCLQFHYKKVHGFTDDFIPKIERSIAYTFDAYSGGAVSEPGRGNSPRFEEPTTLSREQRECGLDLSLVTPAENAKRKMQEDTANPSEVHYVMTDAKLLQQTDAKFANKEAFDRVPEYASASANKDEDGNCKKMNSEIQEPNLDGNQGSSKAIASKGSKKWIGSEAFSGKPDERFKSIFRHENANASLLVEAAINAAEKDIVDKPDEKNSGVPHEDLIENNAEIYSINQYESASGISYDSNEKKISDYGKMNLNVQKSDSFQDDEGKKMFQVSEKSNFTDFIRCNSLLRLNPSPANEIPKDYNISTIIRDQDSEAFTDIEIQDCRNRDLLDAYKDNESFHEYYRTHELYRNEKLDLYRSNESDFRLTSMDKFEYRDFDLTNETYRNLATNLDKYRNADIYRLRSEGYDLGIGYRDLSEERASEAQNLSLKEKSLQYETLEELARIGRDNPGFECLLVGDSSGSAGGQAFGAAAPRVLHGMISPRSYHPTYESESMDLSVPRPSYSSSPIYTLDLTPSRVELPTRHLDFRNHLGLSPHRFQNSRISSLNNGTCQVSPTNYRVYSSPYVTSAPRHSPTSQFQPYSSLYY